MIIGRLVLASLLLFTPTLAAADRDDGPRNQGKHKQGKHKKVKQLLRKFDRLIAKLDQDGDGRLGPDELDSKVGAKLQRFQRFDADGDGWVTREEIIVVMKDRAKARKAKRTARRATAP